MRIEPRRIATGLVLAGAAGALFFLPALAFIGDTFVSHDVPAQTHVPALIGNAIWARANGGAATTLQPLNPFTVGRMAGCHVLAEVRNSERAAADAAHDDCMTLLPGIEAVGYLSSVHLRSEGVWQDPRVPFAQIATMTRTTGTWTREQLLDTLAERGEFAPGFIGVEQAALGFFKRSPADLTVAQAALIAALLGNQRLDPWCQPAAAALSRRRVLERMRKNGVIDDATFEDANRSELGLIDPPPSHTPCKP